MLLERLQILKKVAERALLDYDIEYKEIEFLVEETNVFFKIKASDETQYALKIFQEESTDLNDNKAEIFFLSNLKNIETPVVILNKYSEGITIVDSELTEIPKRVAVYSWLQGEDFDGKETPDNFQKLGRLAAQLHVQTAEFTIPKTIHPKKWDKVFYYPDEKAVYKQEKYRKNITEQTIEIMDKIIPILNEKLANLYNGQQPQLIHADLNPWNVKIYNDKLRVLDFEEAMFGLPIHDLAIIFFYYKNDKNFNYEEVKANVIKGYNEVFPERVFDDETLDMLMIARRVNFLNYSLYLEDAPEEYMKRSTNLIRSYLLTL